MDEKISINWSVYAADINMLATKIRDTVKIADIYAIIAISRGGLIPATMLAHKLKIREIDTIDIRSYTDNGQKRAVKVLRTCDARYVLHRGANTLVVDDLVDSGDTMQEVKKLLPDAITAVVYAKPKAASLVDFSSRQVPQNVWIDFPYE